MFLPSRFPARLLLELRQGFLAFLVVMAQFLQPIILKRSLLSVSPIIGEYYRADLKHNTVTIPWENARCARDGCPFGISFFPYPSYLQKIGKCKRPTPAVEIAPVGICLKCCDGPATISSWPSLLKILNFNSFVNRSPKIRFIF